MSRRGQLSPDGKRLRTIIVAFPVLCVTTAILYRRAFLGEQPRSLPRPQDQTPINANESRQESGILGRGGRGIGGAPWVVQGNSHSQNGVDAAQSTPRSTSQSN